MEVLFFLVFFRYSSIVLLFVNITKKCCIRECKGNYNKENQRKAFRLPNSETERKLCFFLIPRSTLKLGKDAVICEDHWPKNTTMVSHRGKRRTVDHPSIFKVSASREKFTVSSKTIKVAAVCKNILQDEAPAFEENDGFTSFNDFVKRIVTFAHPNCELAKVVLESRVKIVAIECVEGTGIPLFSLDFNEDFTYEAYHCGSRCRFKNLEAHYIKKINRQSLIEEAIIILKTLEIIELFWIKFLFWLQLQLAIANTIMRRSFRHLNILLLLVQDIQNFEETSNYLQYLLWPALREKWRN